MKFFTLTIFFILLFSIPSFAQNPYQHEFGFKVGNYQLRSDYGERADSDTNSGNSGIAFNITYYLNQASSRNSGYFSEHVKLRLDFIYASGDLEHFGADADDPRLEAMTGSFSNIGLSAGLEYFPFGIRLQKYNGYTSFFNNLSPYVGVAVGFNSVSPDAESSLEGGLSNPDNIFPTFFPTDTDNGINLDSSSVLSLNLRAGIRYDIDNRNGLLIESSWMLFGSDLVDGLSPIGPQNKYNDWSWGISVGYSRLLF